MLCTGDREWVNIGLIRQHLTPLGPGTVIVHGDCRGADALCGLVGAQLGYTIKAYPADWHLGHFAGLVRNKAMLTLHPEIGLCLAFHDAIERSRGTADMIARAAAAGIPVRLVSTLPSSMVFPVQGKLL